MNKYFIIASILLIVSFTACEDVLDKKPLDVFSELDVWSDDALAEGFVFDIYNDVVREMYANQFTDDWTDNIVNNSDNGDARNVQAGNIEVSNDFGWDRFGSIRKCNLAIERLTGNESIDKSIRTQLIAEAKMLRSMIYFWQARRFGGLMLVTEVLTPEDEMMLSRTSERETYNFIEQDIEDAIAGLPETAESGRLTKAAAYAFMSQVALQTGDYDKVIAAVDEIEKMDFTLDPVYSNLFNSYSGTTSSSEVIFFYSRGEDHNNFIDTRMFRNLPNVSNGPKLKEDAVPQLHPDDLFEAWPLRWPSQELVDAYLIEENGQAIQKKGMDLQGQPSLLMWQNRDARFEQSIVRDSAQYRNSIFTFRRGGNMHWTSNPASNWGMPKTGYMFRKWMYEEMFFFWNYPVDWAEPIFRLGEVFLNKAEAYGRKGNLPKAIEYMNKTRVTHGELPALSEGSSEEDFWKYYKIERRVEMAQEDDRYWSLIRWARAENASSIPELHGYKLHALDMEFNGLVNVVPSEFTVDMRFDYPKRLLFPVPESQMRLNENLEQNPGWN